MQITNIRPPVAISIVGPVAERSKRFVLGRWVGTKALKGSGASNRSLEWCLKGVDRCWSQKEKFIQASETDDAIAGFSHAREVHRQRLAECEME